MQSTLPLPHTLGPSTQVIHHLKEMDHLAPAQPASAPRRACQQAPPVTPRRTRKPFYVYQQYATLEIERCKEIDRDKLIVHRKQRQSSEAFIKAAQSENKKSENKKVKNRKEGKGSSTARKYCNSCCLDNSFKSKILGKSWQNFSRNYSRDPGLRRGSTIQTSSIFTTWVSKVPTII